MIDLKMGFRSQDKWRRHPMVSGLWKAPLTGLGTAIGIFSVYLAGEYIVDKVFEFKEDTSHAGKIWKRDPIMNTAPTRIGSGDDH